MLLSYLQGCSRNGHQSHVFEVRRSGHQSHAADTFNSSNLCGSIFENTGRAGTGLWPMSEALEQARLLSVELPKLLVFKSTN